MTKSEKTAALAMLERRAVTAKTMGQKACARAWRVYAANLAARPADEIILADAGRRLLEDV